MREIDRDRPSEYGADRIVVAPVWLDDEQLLYGAPDGATWIVRADGTGSARPWAKAAQSATVVRP